MANNYKNCVLFSTVIGGGIGGYLSYIYNNYVFSGIGGAAGYVIGIIVHRLFFIADSSQPRKNKANALLIILGILMSVFGLIAYLTTKDKIMIIGCLFFLISTLYLALKK